jgi:hypothetical protein
MKTMLVGAWVVCLAMCVACEQKPTELQSSRRAEIPAAPLGAKTKSEPATVPAAIVVPATKPNVAAPTKPVTKATSSLEVKRFVVATGVKDREPLLSTGPLPSDGSSIFAYAELANPDGASENVRITFERKGGKERVGDVTLPVPGNVPRHRTWAFTRFIRTAGVWEAVLWSESGQELGRTSFEVTAS